MSDNNTDMRELVASVAAAYFSNSHVAVSDIPSVISQIAGSLSQVGAEGVVASADATTEEQAPSTPKLTAAQIRKSVTPDALVSFEDGKTYKTMKRHLSGRGLTPEQYREKWGLPRDYPMVAPNYSAARADMARKLGLGQRGAAARAQAAEKAKPTRRRTPKA